MEWLLAIAAFLVGASFPLYALWGHIRSYPVRKAIPAHIQAEIDQTPEWWDREFRRLSGEPEPSAFQALNEVIRRSGVTSAEVMKSIEKSYSPSVWIDERGRIMAGAHVDTVTQNNVTFTRPRGVKGEWVVNEVTPVPTPVELKPQGEPWGRYVEGAISAIQEAYSPVTLKNLSISDPKPPTTTELSPVSGSIWYPGKSNPYEILSEGEYVFTSKEVELWRK